MERDFSSVYIEAQSSRQAQNEIPGQRWFLQVAGKLTKRFPEHPRTFNIEKVDVLALIADLHVMLAFQEDLALEMHTLSLTSILA